MYKSLCVSARNALRCRLFAMHLRCEGILELDTHALKLEEAKVSQKDPSKRSLFQRLGGGGDAVEQIAKCEAKVAANGDLVVKRRQVYSEVRAFSPAVSADCHCSRHPDISHASNARFAERFRKISNDCTSCSCRISKP